MLSISAPGSLTPTLTGIGVYPPQKANERKLHDTPDSAGFSLRKKERRKPDARACLGNDHSIHLSSSPGSNEQHLTQGTWSLTCMAWLWNRWLHRNSQVVPSTWDSSVTRVLHQAVTASNESWEIQNHTAANRLGKRSKMSKLHVPDVVLSKMSSAGNVVRDLGLTRDAPSKTLHS